MTVAVRGYTQGAYDSDGEQTVAWPSGTAVGDLAVILCATGKNKKPTTKLPAGWVQKRIKSDKTSVWAKKLTAADIAVSLAVTARVQLLQVLSGAGSVGKIGAGESIKVTQDGGALLLCGWKTTDDTLTATNKIHATDVQNESWVTKGKTRVYNTWFASTATAGTRARCRLRSTSSRS